MGWYAWPTDSIWQPACNPRTPELRRALERWEEATFGTTLCRNYDPAYLVAVFLPELDDMELLFLSARFAYVVFTLDTLLEHEDLATDAELATVLDALARTVSDPAPPPLAAGCSDRLRLYHGELRRVWDELVQRFPTPVHESTMRTTIVTYFRESIPAERRARAGGSFSLAEYERFRPYTIQSMMGYDVINLSFTVSADEMEELSYLRHRASLLTGIINDVTSFPRERGERSQVNLVSWAMDEHRCTEEEAIARVVAYADEVIRDCARELSRIARVAPRVLPLARACINASVGECMFFHTAARYCSDSGWSSEGHRHEARDSVGA